MTSVGLEPPLFSSVLPALLFWPDPGCKPDPQVSCEFVSKRGHYEGTSKEKKKCGASLCFDSVRRTERENFLLMT